MSTNSIFKYSPAAGEHSGSSIGPGNTVLMNSPFRGMENIGEVYFIGIGGIGMSAIARFFQSKGVVVSGYDKTSTPLTKELEASGIKVYYDENADRAPKNANLVIYTPAIPKQHSELVYYQKHGYKVVKRSDVLQIITESSFNICIAGTHGKTTITTMVAHLLRHTGFGCNAFLGGISVNYGTNFWSNERNVVVVEADEYDRSFLKLSPDVAIITAMDADHLDIYGTADAVEQAFIDFSGRVKPGGLLIWKFGLDRGNELKASSGWTYGLKNEEADVYTANIRVMNGSYEFDVVIKDRKLENVKLNMGGLHNVENAIAAIAVACSLGIESEKIKAAVESFRGVKRRFEYVVKNDDLVYVDDYAHHPEELRALINGARNLFGERKLTVIFQPHLFTRTRDFADGFAEVLDMADEVFLLPIYPARELPIEGVTSEMIASKMSKAKALVKEKDEVLALLKERGNKGTDILVTAGAGDIDTIVLPIKEILTSN